MTAAVERKNFFMKQGRLLATGEYPTIVTPEEWLYLSPEVKDDLVGPQEKLFAGFEERIRGRIVERALDNAAV